MPGLCKRRGITGCCWCQPGICTSDYWQPTQRYVFMLLMSTLNLHIRLLTAYPKVCVAVDVVSQESTIQAIDSVLLLIAIRNLHNITNYWQSIIRVYCYWCQSGICRSDYWQSTQRYVCCLLMSVKNMKTRLLTAYQKVCVAVDVRWEFAHQAIGSLPKGMYYCHWCQPGICTFYQEIYIAVVDFNRIIESLQ